MNFKEYMDLKEDEETGEYNILNEEAVMAAAIILGLPAVSALIAYGGSQLLFAMARGTRGIIKSWKIALSEVRKIKSDIKEDITVDDYIRKVRSDPMVNRMHTEEKANQREHEDVLSKVYSAIEEGNYLKDNNKAGLAFRDLPKNIQNSPDIKRAIINEIVKKTGEPVMWPPSPGNISYQAIRNSIGIREAKAEATAFRMNLMKTAEKITAESKK